MILIVTINPDAYQDQNNELITFTYSL